VSDPDSDKAVIGQDATAAGALGESTLAAMVSGSAGGIAIVDSTRQLVYANPAACELLGRPLDQLRGRDLLDRFPTHERTVLRLRLGVVPADARETFSSVVLAADDEEREVVCSTFAIEGGAGPLVVVTLWDLSGPHSAARAAVALAQTAARLVGTTPTNQLLVNIARHAVEGTRARSCGIAVVGEDDRYLVGGGFGPGYGVAPRPGQTRSPGWTVLADVSGSAVTRAMSGGAIRIGDVPGKASVLPNSRAVWESDPVTRPFTATLGDLDWDVLVCVPLSWQNRVIGMLIAYLPPGVRGPEESELAFYTALADQSALAVMTARLAEEAGIAAALSERGRLARDLHDSVSQALFSMTMHARAAQLSMADSGVDGDGPLGRSVAQLAELTRGALSEMRALIFELRPGALTEEGLLGALRRQGAVLSTREGFTLTVEGPESRLGLGAEIEEHLYRIVSEALHNIAKHAGASSVTVAVVVEHGVLGLTVTDDGCGFDPERDFPGHLGLSTMAQRADAIDAQLEIASTVGRGTVVSVSVELPDA
jgi:PAS domain S-box-containing protein